MGWKVIVDSTKIEDHTSGMDKLDWYEQLVLPLALHSPSSPILGFESDDYPRNQDTKKKIF